MSTETASPNASLDDVVSTRALRVDDEFEFICPPLAQSEFELLEASILDNGCRDPIVIWDGAIVDGHNRYAICRMHGLEFSTHEMAFADRSEAREWILTNQLARRNLGFLQAAYLRGCYYRQVRDAKREAGYKQEQVAKLFSVSVPTIRSDREVADAVDTLCLEAREYVLGHGVVASKRQVLDLAQLSYESQKYIIEKISDGYLDGLRQAILRLRPPSSTKTAGIQRKRSRCQTCGARLAEGVFTCLKCDLDESEVRSRIDRARPLNESDDEEIQQRIAVAREFKQQADKVAFAAQVILDFLEGNEVERNSDYRAILSKLMKALMGKVGQRKATDKMLRVLIDAEGDDRKRLDELTPKQRECFHFIREFSMGNGRPPKLSEIGKGMKLGQGTEQSERSAALAYVKQLREKGIVVRD